MAAVPLANRATIGNMSPEYGSTCAIFPIDDETLNYLRFTGRSEEQVALVEAYAKEQGLWHDPSREARYSETLELDLSTIEPSLAGPEAPAGPGAAARAPRRGFRTVLRDYVDRRPRARERRPRRGFRRVLPGQRSRPPRSRARPSDQPVACSNVGDVGDRASNAVSVTLDDGTTFQLDHGAVVIAAITSCTNTSNPQVMVGAALLAKKAVEKGLSRKPWVKTTLAPGQQGRRPTTTTAAGSPPTSTSSASTSSATAAPPASATPARCSRRSRAGIAEGDLAVVSVLSGNRNFEGRINPDIKMNYLASPPLVVAYALAGTMDLDITTEPLGIGTDGEPVYLADLWPTEKEIADVIGDAIQSDMFTNDYANVFAGDERWQGLPLGDSGPDAFSWDEGSTYVRRPPYFEGMEREPAARTDIEGARVLAMLGDSVTTDHISPAGSIKKDSPAGRYLAENGVDARRTSTPTARAGATTRS